MSSTRLYRALVPDAPLHRRTEGDEYRTSFEYLDRLRSTSVLLETIVKPGLQRPKLISSFQGSIDRVLFSFPSWAVEGDLAPAYRSVIKALRHGTDFIVVHHASIRERVAQWFAEAGHDKENVTLISMPDYVSLTDWAEDAYVSLTDESDGSGYLMEPWEFKRAGDALIADAVEDHTDVKASQAPLIFQGGNCLIGTDFWFLGRDYFADTLALLNAARAPVKAPEGQSSDAFARELFSKYVDAARKVILIGTKKPIPIREYVGTKSGSDYLLDVPAGGAGTFQPIFHIDMFISLVGPGADGKFCVLVGSPALGDQLLGTSSPFSLPEVYDEIAQSLASQGFSVMRNPLVHRSTLTKQTLKLSKLKEMSGQPGNEALSPAVKELAAAGAKDGTDIRVRDWHHITWNNCLVENSAKNGRNVYLPTFGYGSNSDLKAIDFEMKSFWEKLGFKPQMLGDFNQFAARLGVVHCIKKYITRGT